MDKIQQLEKRLAFLERIIQRLYKSDRMIFERLIQMSDGVNVQLGRSSGTMIGTATDQHLGFYGATPVDRPETVNSPSGGATQDAEARTAIISTIDRLQELGLIA